MTAFGWCFKARFLCIIIVVSKQAFSSFLTKPESVVLFKLAIPFSRRRKSHLHGRVFPSPGPMRCT